MKIKSPLFLEEFEEIMDEVDHNLIEINKSKVNTHYFMFFFFMMSFLQKIFPISLWNNLFRSSFKEDHENTVKNDILYLNPGYITPDLVFPLEEISHIIENLSNAPSDAEIYLDEFNDLIIEPIYWYQKRYPLTNISPNRFFLGQYNLMKKLYLSHQIGLLNPNDYHSLRIFYKKFYSYKKYRILNNFIDELCKMNVIGMQKQLNLFFKKHLPEMVDSLFSYDNKIITAKKKSITRFGENWEHIQTIHLKSKNYSQLLLALYLDNIIEQSHPNNTFKLSIYNELSDVEAIKNDATLFSLFIATIDIFAQKIETYETYNDKKYTTSAYEIIFKSLHNKLPFCNEIIRKRYYLSCIKTKRFHRIGIDEILFIKDDLTPDDCLEIGDYLYDGNVELIYLRQKTTVGFKNALTFYSQVKKTLEKSFSLESCVNHLEFIEILYTMDINEIELYIENLYNLKKVDLIIKITNELFKKNPELFSATLIKYQMLAHTQCLNPIVMINLWINIWVNDYKVSSTNIPAICWDKSAEIYMKKKMYETSRVHFIQAGAIYKSEINFSASQAAFEKALEISLTIGKEYKENFFYKKALYNFDYSVRIIDDYLVEKTEEKKLAYFFKIRIFFEQLKYSNGLTQNEIKQHKINNKENIDTLKDLLRDVINMSHDDSLYLAEFYFLLAEVYRYSDLDGINQENMIKQIENYSKATDHQPDNVYYLMALAKTYALCNFDDKAQHIFDKIERLVVNFNLGNSPLNSLYEYLNENFLQTRVKSFPRLDWDFSPPLSDSSASLNQKMADKYHRLKL